MKNNKVNDSISLCFVLEFFGLIGIYMLLKTYLGLGAAELFMVTVLAFALHDCVVHASEKIEEDNIRQLDGEPQDDVEEHKEKLEEADKEEDNDAKSKE